jgi:hypothetical protein
VNALLIGKTIYLTGGANGMGLMAGKTPVTLHAVSGEILNDSSSHLSALFADGNAIGGPRSQSLYTHVDPLEDAMRSSMFVPLLALVLVVGCASQTQYQATGNGGPKPDGHFQLMTTSIAPDVGVTWADAWLSFNNLDYKFRVEAETITE